VTVEVGDLLESLFDQSPLEFAIVTELGPEGFQFLWLPSSETPRYEIGYVSHEKVSKQFKAIQ